MSNTISPGKQYVCGFLFQHLGNGARVMLIEKKRPAWMAGKLNGIGGAIKPDESPVQAMIREFKQETGVTFDNWIYFCQMRYIDKATIHFFYGIAPVLFNACKTQTDETLVNTSVDSDILEVFRQQMNIVPDLRWLIPMAFRMADEGCKYLEVVKCGV